MSPEQKLAELKKWRDIKPENFVCDCATRGFPGKPSIFLKHDIQCPAHLGMSRRAAILYTLSLIDE